MAETMSGRKPTFTKTDFTTYQDIWYAFQQIYRLCAQEYGVPGWIEIGEFTGAIGSTPKPPLEDDRYVEGEES